MTDTETVKGVAFFFNSIEGCQLDVLNLKWRLDTHHWVCKDVIVNDLEDFPKQAKILLNLAGGVLNPFKTVIVFFYGYGFVSEHYEFYFLGTSTKIAISREILYEQLDYFRAEESVLVVFTNICRKLPVPRFTYQYLEPEKIGWNVFHIDTTITGTGNCHRGSWMTYLLLHNMDIFSPTWNCYLIAKKLMREMEKKRMWKDDYYQCSVRQYGMITEDVEIPSLSDWKKRLVVLSSRVVRQHRIPYLGIIPKYLEDWVQIHE